MQIPVCLNYIIQVSAWYFNLHWEHRHLSIQTVSECMCMHTLSFVCVNIWLCILLGSFICLCVQSYVQKYVIIFYNLLKAGNLSLVKEKLETDLIRRYFLEICFKYIYTKKKKTQFYLEKCITSSKEKN